MARRVENRVRSIRFIECREATDLIVRANALNGSINELRRSSEGMIAIATRIEKAVK